MKSKVPWTDPCESPLKTLYLVKKFNQEHKTKNEELQI